MRAVSTPFASLSNTPLPVNAGLMTEVQTLFAHNPGEVSGAYVKLYELAGTVAPDGTAVPVWAAWVGPGAADSGGASVVLPAFISYANLWIAVATQYAAGLTAPATAFNVTLTRSVVGGPGPGAG